MAKYLQIQIPKGCDESWDNMGQQHNGKFCNSCQKTVIDFTRMTDEQLVQFFKKRKDNICGRFTSEQLNTDIQIPAKRIPWLKYFFTISIPAFLVSLKTTAQINNSKDLIEINSSDNKKPELKHFKDSDSIKLINGIVTSTDGMPVAGATIKIKGYKIGVIADTSGKFRINVPVSSTLVISSVGMIPIELSTKNLDEANVILIRTSYAIMGDVVITSYRKNKKNKSVSVSNIESQTFTIFPNPITSFSKLNIKWSSAVTTDQTIQIYNQAGVLQQQDIIKINKSSNQQAIDLKQLLPGTYIIKITDNKTHKSFSQQFIVQ